jgi:hypothetical protein
MGKFKLTKKTVVIDFAEGSPWYGVEAKVSLSVPFKTLFWFQKNASSSDSESAGEAIYHFGEQFLIEWNVEDEDGNPCPTTGEGVLNLDDTGLVTSLMSAWVEAVVQPSENLGNGSKGTATSEKQSMEQLANLSESLGS